MPGVPTFHPTIAAITLLFQWPTGMFRITTFHSLNAFFTLLPALPIKPNWIQWTLSTAFTLENTPSYVRLPPFFVCLASPSILLVFFCVFCPALPHLCSLLGFFSFSWFPFFGSGSPWAASFCFLLCLRPLSSFFFVVCQVPAGGRSCNTTQKKKKLY